MKQETRRRHSPVLPAVFLMLLLLAIAVAGIFWGFGDVLRPSEPDKPETSMDGSDTQQAQEPAPAPQPEETENPEPSEEEEVPTEQVSTEQETSDPAQPASEDPWYLTLVNRWNPLPEDFAVSLTPIGENYQVDSRCAGALHRMLEDCRAAGLSPAVCSAYRTEETQARLYANKVDRLMAQGMSEDEARTEAARSVAVPGTSEHQLGLAVDLVDNHNWSLDESQASMPAQQWLIKHSWEYGFVLRYPNEKSEITGIIYEPWHYRYVGVENAKAITESGKCLEEYLDGLSA